jgi:Zn finger protein HypA/HybF involved in hydrogenase expression
MIGEISGAFSSLGAAVAIVKGLNAASTQAAVDEAKIALQGHLLEAQQAIFAAQAMQVDQSRRIAELEAEISRLQSWEAEKARYELKQFTSGALAYVLRADAANGEPDHQLCPHCFQNGAKSFLQPSKGAMAGVHSCTCPRCQSAFATGPKFDYSI